ASLIHLLGDVRGRSDLYDASDAGIAEAVIAAVLAAGAWTMVRRPTIARSAGPAAIGFATAGFVIGLTITASSGHAPAIAYHATVLPVLLGSLAVLALRSPQAR